MDSRIVQFQLRGSGSVYHQDCLKAQASARALMQGRPGSPAEGALEQVHAQERLNGRIRHAASLANDELGPLCRYGPGPIQRALVVRSGRGGSPRRTAKVTWFFLSGCLELDQGAGDDTAELPEVIRNMKDSIMLPDPSNAWCEAELAAEVDGVDASARADSIKNVTLLVGESSSNFQQRRCLQAWVQFEQQVTEITRYLENLRQSQEPGISEPGSEALASKLALLPPRRN
ncbi:hypothetical protein VTK26DRAFT_4410 [Humicola hyalothermophila]